MFIFSPLVKINGIFNLNCQITMILVSMLLRLRLSGRRGYVSVSICSLTQPLMFSLSELVLKQP